MQCRYHSSILYIRRNILTYLSMLLVISMNITSNSTVQGDDDCILQTQNGFNFRILVSSTDWSLAASPRSWPGSTMTVSTWASTCSSQLTAASQYSGFSWSSRHLSNQNCWKIYFSFYNPPQPDRFWNADHERVYKMLFVVMFLLSAAAILAVELYHSLYYEGKSLSLKNKVKCIFICRSCSVANWVLPDWKQKGILYPSNPSLVALGLPR